MRICPVRNGYTCSTVPDKADLVRNAYTIADVETGGIGGNADGLVRLVANIQ